MDNLYELILLSCTCLPKSEVCRNLPTRNLYRSLQIGTAFGTTEPDVVGELEATGDNRVKLLVQGLIAVDAVRERRTSGWTKLRVVDPLIGEIEGRASDCAVVDKLIHGEVVDAELLANVGHRVVPRDGPVLRTWPGLEGAEGLKGIRCQVGLEEVLG